MTQIPQILFAEPVKAAMDWGCEDGVIFQEKFDGVRALLEWGKLRGRARQYKLPGAVPHFLRECVLDGELIGGHFYAFDCVAYNGREVSQMPLEARMGILESLSPLLPHWMHRVLSFQHGGRLLAAVLSRGGEGIVRKELHTTWGHGWVKVKRAQTEDCVVLRVNACSIEVGQYRGGQLVSVGKVPTTREGFRAGQVVEVECHSRHASGKLREPRIVRVREDKPAGECLFEQ